jgi:DNA (cytosine-5)-methyltransferase 1
MDTERTGDEMKLRIGSFFSGIGAFEKALERLEIPHETVFYCEIDKYASKAYSLIHDISENFNLWDITKVDETKLPDFDLMTWGFPCQDISVAGKQAGIIEGETRSGLYHDGLRILRYKKPKYSIIENVKNLVGKKFQAEFNQMLCDLEDAGYRSYWQVLNAKDYGIPQNRERIFIVSVRKDVDQGFMFPQPFDNGLRLKDLLEDEVDEKYYISQEKTEKLLAGLIGKDMSDGIISLNPKREDGKQTYQQDRVYDTDGLMTTLSAQLSGRFNIAIPVLTLDREEKRQNGRRFKEDGEQMFSLTTQDRHGILINRDNQVIPDDGLCRCIPASYYHGLDNHGARTGVLQQVGMLDIKGNEQIRRVYDSEGLSPTLNCMEGGNRQPKVLINEPTVFEERKDEGMRFFEDGVVGTLRTISDCGDKRVIYPNYRIRKLTPLECFRLMGFDDADYWVCKNAGISDSQLYKMAGNSIVVQVLEGILTNLFIKSGADVPDYFYAEQLALFG